MVDTVLLDVDGTLIDNNLLHVLAWRRAFERLGKEVPASAILYKIGMGGDHLAPAILGDDDEKALKRAEELHGEEYSKSGLIEHSRLLPGATELLRGLRARGVQLALASSAKPEEIERYLKLLGGRGVVDHVVTKEDVAASKPSPDIFAQALKKFDGPRQAIVIGDTVYDISAAKKVGLPCVAVLSGGIERDLLLQAGAVAVYDNAAAILADLDAVLAITHTPATA